MKTMKNLYIFGTKFFDLIKLVEAINMSKPTWKICGFFDTKNRIKGDELWGYPLIGIEKVEKLARDKNNYFFCNKPRNYKAAHFLISNNCNIATLVHPNVDLNFVEIGKGCILPEGCVVGGRTKIGDFVTVRLNSLISHDVTVEDFAFIGPSASIAGESVLKKRCFIGQGAVVMTGRVIGEESVVGAGAVVTKDVPPGTVVIGIPAKPM
jgi:sugar O-acyltransferase (sialic acid O-acetyltransferase NeuD family)